MDLSIRISTAALSLLFSSSAFFVVGFHIGKSSANQGDKQSRTEVVKTKTETMKMTTETIKTR